MKPILKWAGNKSQLIKRIERYMPKEYNTYFEAFLGGGSLFFDLMPEKAYINDKNEELINVYNSIKNNSSNLIVKLQEHQKNNSESYYYEIRDIDRNSMRFKRMSEAAKAARTIYLNKTCYAGLYRVNSLGQFNTPYANYANPSIFDESRIREASKYFKEKEIHISSMDFAEFLHKAKEGDFVYLDPPYWSEDKQKMFTSYQKEGFDVHDQQRLKETCDKLSQRGVYVIVSNAATSKIRNLYSNGYVIHTARVERYIGNQYHDPMVTREFIICNYDSEGNILL